MAKFLVTRLAIRLAIILAIRVDTGAEMSGTYLFELLLFRQALDKESPMRRHQSPPQQLHIPGEKHPPLPLRLLHKLPGTNHPAPYPSPSPSPSPFPSSLSIPIPTSILIFSVSLYLQSHRLSVMWYVLWSM